ncbi:heavy metal translocating P-type ATPase [Aminipila butyrica]|uniref:Copper-exporting P-type ATPase n=1 Tax=Aminipila butyrica TaxID=433296 RepID=A0A858C1G3_9FIRM|nr:heavy metal translocating P-type ATPase [Aminipila butyrica]QIB70366.1 heavy metal translocating P-type ATPase [Aminipila butyrica]
MKEKFNVTGMTCSACSSRVEKSVGKLEGVKQVSVNLLTNSMQVEYEEKDLSRSDIIHRVEQAGYGAALAQTTNRQSLAADEAPSARGELAGGTPSNPMEEQVREMKGRFVLSLGFLIPLMYISMGHMISLPLPGFLHGHENAVSFAFTQFLLCLPIVYANRQYFIKGFRTLAHGAPNMDSLIAVGSSAALVYGIFAIYRMSYGLGAENMDVVMAYSSDLYFESAATILTLITLGKLLEARSKGKTSEALTKLMDLAPKTALVEREGREVQVPVEEVLAGETVVVKPGSSIPVDGIIREGSTSIDESAITGESLPVYKEIGMSVIAATTNKSGFVKIEATKVGADTTFSQIIRLVEEASSTKAPIAKLADKIAGVFVPVVMAIALLTALVWLLAGADFEFALSMAISVLVISCPCALGLATPVAIMVGTGKGAEHGILIKSGEALELAHSLDSVVLDKTGTITEGRPVVTDVIALGGTPEALLEIACSLEAKSEHPLAEAILDYGSQKGIVINQVADFQSISGKGVRGALGEQVYFAGNQKLMKENGIELADNQEQIDQLAMEGKTPMMFASSSRLIGLIAVADVVKATSREAIQALRDLNMEVTMLTGDNQKTAEGIGRSLPLNQVIAEVLPQEKEKVLAGLQAQGKKVAMVGDGINDAPALVRADVGMAIGAGTDIAMESADIILMKNDLLDVVTAIRLSRAVIRNIKQNLFWAFFYNCLGIPLAAGLLYPAFGLRLSPMFAAAAMSFSSVFVVSNALRLKMFKGGNPGNNNSYRAEEAVQKKAIELKKIEEQEENQMVTLKIEGMMCQNCVKHVKEALESFKGASAEVNLDHKEAKVEIPSTISTDALKSAVEQAGYTVTDIIK